MLRHYIDIESPELLQYRQDQLRAPGKGELAITVDYAGINRADILLIRHQNPVKWKNPFEKRMSGWRGTA